MRYFLIALGVMFAGFLGYHFSSNAPVTTEEVYRADEAEQIQRSVNNFLKVVDENRTDYVARGAHSKGHACVKTWFDVAANIPADYQHGIFNTPGKRYKGWIRFSNGRSSLKGNHDADKDAHGMAIKLFDIDAENLNGEPIQDFLMHDHPVFFAANMEDYNTFVESDNKILYFVSDPNPLNWQLREMKHGLQTLKPPPPSPLWATYFSNTAYKLGPYNIKFSTRACSEPALVESQNKSDPDFLGKTLQQELNASEACFDFLIQVQKTDKYMPIEDPSIEWKAGDSPYFPVARLIIPKQTFDTEQQQQFCEDLSFSPWNALAEHRPIGELNRIRKLVYEASSRFRHEENKTEVPTNLSW